MRSSFRLYGANILLLGRKGSSIRMQNMICWMGRDIMSRFYTSKLRAETVKVASQVRARRCSRAGKRIEEQSWQIAAAKMQSALRSEFQINLKMLVSDR
jgi:hypothetical protein